MENGSVISRRKFMGAVGVVAGTTALAPIVRAACRQIRRPGEHGHDTTASLRSERVPDDIRRSRRHHHRPAVE